MIHVGAIGLVLLAWRITLESEKHDNDISETISKAGAYVGKRTAYCLRFIALRAIRSEKALCKWMDCYSGDSSK